MHDLVIAIDGPSGSGKSSTARGVAQRLGLAYLDTGSMYRAATVAWLASGIPSDDTSQVADMVSRLHITVRTDPREPAIAVNAQDVTQTIREPQIVQKVSTVATNLPVRELLTAQMRQIIADSSRRIVVEGRDITTVVAPDAQMRVLLVADPSTRITRRAAETTQKITDDQLTDQIVRRDRDDSTVSEFSNAAPGVTQIDSTNMTLRQVIDAICALVPVGLA